MELTRNEIRLIAVSVVIGLFLAVVVIFTTTEPEAREKAEQPPPPAKIFGEVDESPGYLDKEEKARMNRIFPKDGS